LKEDFFMELKQYAATVFLSVLAALVLMVLIGTNTRVGKAKKNLFLATAALLALAAAAEYLGVRLNGAPEKFRVLHAAVKVLELSLSPFLIIMLISALNGFRRARMLLPVAAANAVLELASSFSGFLFYINANNMYCHGTYYWIYILVNVLCGVYFFLECVRFSRQYQNRGGASLAAILMLLTTGLSIHLFQPDVRVDWLTLILGDALFFIYYSGLVEQMDSLTRLLDRKSYDIQVSTLRERAILLVFDIDRFKEINDTYGHDVGDACLKTVSAILKKSYGRYGLCYRTGGDEFCVIVTKTDINLPVINTAFCARLEAARETMPETPLPSVSLGYAVFNPRRGTTADAVRAADAMMYQYKWKRRTDKTFSVSSRAAE
jgi:diguanylate cyclase (GGDEF)-like protein